MLEIPAVFSILFEDDYLSILSKEALVHSTGASHAGENSLSEALLSDHVGLENSAKALPDAGLIQRLDFSSSGLLIAAKTDESYQKLRTQLFAGKIEKEYLCLVQGNFQGTQEIEGFIGSPNRGAKKMRFYRQEPRSRERALPSESVFTLAAGAKDASFLWVKASPARRHQVRLHASVLGHALLGDALYGGPPIVETSYSQHPLFIDNKRQFFLHASSLAFEHPRSGEMLKFTSIPAELSDLQFSTDR
jgi:23S rRNA pseudouridine1911/1915/1917 synthase